MTENSLFNSEGGGNAAVVVQLQGIVQQLSALVGVFSGRFVFGTFSLAASATTTVQNASVQSNSDVVFSPSNAAAATLMGSNDSLYVSAKAAGVSFTVATASGAAAAGTETFSYYIITPM